jgi:hypothetical protein
MQFKFRFHINLSTTAFLGERKSRWSESAIGLESGALSLLK